MRPRPFTTSTSCQHRVVIHLRHRWHFGQRRTAGRANWLTRPRRPPLFCNFPRKVSPFTFPQSDVFELSDDERTSRVVGSTTRVVGSTTRVVGSTTRVVGSTTRVVGSTTRVVGRTTRVVGSTTRVVGSTTRVVGSTTRVVGSNTRVVGSTTRVVGSTTLVVCSTTRVVGSATRVVGSTTQSFADKKIFKIKLTMKCSYYNIYCN